MRPDFEDDLGVPGERDRGRRGVHTPTVHEHGHLGSSGRAERCEPGAGQRLAPRAEQVGEREPGEDGRERQLLESWVEVEDGTKVVVGKASVEL